MKKNLAMFLLFAFLAVSFIGFADPASANLQQDLSGTLDEIGGSGGGVLPQEAQEKVKRLSKDAIDIIRYVVIAVLFITCLITGMKFGNAGDNSQAKAALKGLLILQILGILFVANIHGIFKFFFNIQIF